MIGYCKLYNFKEAASKIRHPAFDAGPPGKSTNNQGTAD